MAGVESNMKRVNISRCIRRLLLVTYCFFLSCKAEDATDDFIRKCVEEEIARQVEARVQRANQRIVNLKENIKAIVSDEVTRQVDDIRQEAAVEHKKQQWQKVCVVEPQPERQAQGWCKKKKYEHKTGVSHQERGDCYLHPYWPAYSQFFSGLDLFQLTFEYDTATQSYSSHGKTADVFNVGCKKSVKLKDILLASKLVSNGKLKTSAGFVNPQLLKDNHYLGFMADLPIIFDGNQDFFRFNVNWARNYWDGDVSVGVLLPFAIRHLSMKIKGCIPDDIKAKIANVERGLKADGQPLILDKDHPEQEATNSTVADKRLDQTTIIQKMQSFQFNQLYGSFQEFVLSILKAKNIDLYRNTTSLELGDISFYSHLNIHSRYYKEGLVGLQLVLPSAQRTDGFALFDPAVGNNGTTQLSAFLSFVWDYRWWCNPHIHMTGSYSFPAHVRMRVPRLLEQGKNTYPARELILGKDLQYTDQAFMELDSSVKGFADTTSRVRVSAAPELFLRLGNVIEHAGLKRAFLDFYYDFFVRGRSSHSRSVLETSVATGERVICTGFSLNDRTWEVYHRLGADWSYQFNQKYRSRLGAFYTLAGANTPKKFGISMQLSAAF